MTGIYFEALGQRLKNIREERGLTLREIADRTRIPLSNLEAIEDGNPERLPAPVFVKGFLRSYAIELGLDHGKVIDEYKSYGAEPEAELAEVKVPTRQQFTELPKVLTGLRKVVLLLFGAAAVFLVIYLGAPPLYRVVKAWMDRPETESGYTASSQPGAGGREQDSGDVTFSNESESPSTPVASLEPMPMAEVDTEEPALTAGERSGFGLPSLPETIGTSTESTPSSDSAAPLPPSTDSEGTVFTMPQPVVIRDSTISSTAGLPSDVGAGMETVAPGSGLANGSGTAGQSTAGPHELRLVFTKESWIQIVVDEKETQHGLYQPGQSNTWVAENNFLVRIGNAGGVQAYFDGRDLGSLGRAGRAVSISLPSRQ